MAEPAEVDFAPRLVKQTVEGAFHHTITCDLELNLMDPDLDERFDLDDVPLAGDWALEVERRDNLICLRAVHGSRWGARVHTNVKLYYTAGGQHTLLKESRWHLMPRPDRAEAGRVFVNFVSKIPLDLLMSSGTANAHGYDPNTHRNYRCVIYFDARGGRPLPEAQTLIQRLPAVELSPAPANVRIFFPTCEAELWADSGFLNRSSPYFKTLLSSDFAEAVTMPSKRPRTRDDSTAATTLVDADAKDFDDSDNETDKLYFEKHPALQHKRDELQHPFKEIKITATAFTTYRAVLAFLRTGFIAFAPLSSTLPESDAPGISTRRTRIEDAVSANPSLPYPVSPKSTYRLAHLLELKELQQLSLANLSEQLTPDSAPKELFSDTTVCYDAWRNVILDYIVKNCDAVTKSAAWTEATSRVERDEVPGAAPIMLDLFKRKVIKTA